MADKLRKILAGAALVSGLAGCGAHKIENLREVKDESSVSCESLTIDNQKVLVIDEVHGGKTLDYDAAAEVYRLSNFDMGVYFDVGLNGKLDMYIETNFRNERRPTRPIQEVTKQYLIVDDSNLMYDPSRYLYPSPSPKTTIRRNTEEARSLQNRFESIKERCEV